MILSCLRQILGFVLLRGLATALAYRYLAKELTDENVKLSYVLGWCVEIVS